MRNESIIFHVIYRTQENEGQDKKYKRNFNIFHTINSI